MVEAMRTLCRLWRMPSASREELLEFQFRKLRSLVRWAYETVPYYHALFSQAGLKPQDIRSLADLTLLPITSSQEYRIRPLSEVLSKHTHPGRLVRRPTSGSSGKPFVILRTAGEDHLLNQFRLRAYRSFGIRAGDRIAHVRLVSGHHRRQSLAGRTRQALRLYREYPIDSRESPSSILAQLEHLQPDVIKGYPSVLTQMSRCLLEESSSSLQPRLLIAGGEMLGEFRRTQIQKAFGRPLFDLYGSHEFNLLAWQCPEAGGYHICEDNVILEFLKDGRPARPGEKGEVVVTGLHCLSMPFIRYQLGDVATRGPDTCRCGAPFASLQDIEGRKHDYFRMPDGTYLHPDRLVVPIMEAEAPWFDRYRLLQIQTDRILLQIQPLRKPGPEQLASVNTIARQHLPDEVHFSLELVDQLEVEPGGKFRFCRSFVESPPGEAFPG
jgi:phenylacetate-CoA ligase